MNARMIKAEVMKLAKRRGLMAWALLLTAGGVVIMFTVLAIRHGSDPHKYGPAGGKHNFENAMFFLSSIGAAAAILVGVQAGTGDLSAGVFRDLVATGRSRMALFRVRWIGALIVFLPLILIGIGIVMLASTALAGSLAAPSLSYMLSGAGWVLLTTLVTLGVAVGLSSVIGSRTVATTALMSWQIIVTPILLNIGFLGAARDGLLGAATRHFAPAGILGARGGYAIAGATAAIATIVVWLLVSLRAGAWRTRTIDA
jgi:ABC-type transport system involved in multi-copper enzyme maturation permease subunit